MFPCSPCYVPHGHCWWGGLEARPLCVTQSAPVGPMHLWRLCRNRRRTVWRLVWRLAWRVVCAECAGCDVWCVQAATCRVMCDGSRAQPVQGDLLQNTERHWTQNLPQGKLSTLLLHQWKPLWQINQIQISSQSLVFDGTKVMNRWSTSTHQLPPCLMKACTELFFASYIQYQFW